VTYKNTEPYIYASSAASSFSKSDIQKY
jgi:hypothetical protein